MRHKNKTILWVGTRNLRHSFTAATQRTQHIVDYTTTQWGWTWYFASPLATHTDHNIQPNASLPETLPSQIDILWFDRYFSVELFRVSLLNKYPNAHQILDLQDIHSLREYRRIHQERYKEPIFPKSNTTALPIALREYAAMIHMDYILSTAAQEMNHLKSYFQNLPPCLHIPLLHDLLGTTPTTYSGSKTCYFIGNASQKPNKEAAQYLVNQYWPKFHKSHSTFSLEIIGEGFENTFPRYDRHLNISCLGTVKDLQTTINNKIGLFPLQHGAGTKGKILECLAYGNPCITTPSGAESISALQGKGTHWIALSEKHLTEAIIAWSKPSNTLLYELREAQNHIVQQHRHNNEWIEPLKRSLSQTSKTNKHSLEIQAIKHFQTKYYDLLQRYIQLKNDT